MKLKPIKPYFIKTSKIISDVIYPSLYWKVPVSEKKIFITFDDGPSPGVTEKVLEILKKYDAQATFFLIADKVKNNPGMVKLLIQKGHGIGNHTFHHLNGWKTANDAYFEDIDKANAVIDSPLFRPPYGKISRSQLLHLREKYSIIMWDLLSGDFDQKLSPESCYENISQKATSGSIVVFHDSEKAAPRMLYALPKFLEEYKNQGYAFDKITPEILKED
jgi:peptidoglycan/xylan/chitin deacetylase (PgdA/CDA1 family)